MPEVAQMCRRAESHARHDWTCGAKFGPNAASVPTLHVWLAADSAGRDRRRRLDDSRCFVCFNFRGRAMCVARIIDVA